MLPSESKKNGPSREVVSRSPHHSPASFDFFCFFFNCAWPECGNKHLMTGPEGNSEFCFPETLNVPRGEAEGNTEVEGKQNSLFPMGPVIKCFVIPPNSRWNNTLMSAYDFIAKCYKSQ